MSEMIERVVKALDAWAEDRSGRFEAYKTEDLVRVVMGAMREPTGPMIDAGNSYGEESSWAVERNWQAMLDEALK